MGIYSVKIIEGNVTFFFTFKLAWVPQDTPPEASSSRIKTPASQNSRAGELIYCITIDTVFYVDLFGSVR
jgi:hypothetical protein